MIKVLFLLVGLAAGFGGGVYWGVKHPEQAATLSAEEERRFIEAQVKITQELKKRLDRLASRSGKTSGSGFLAQDGPDPEVVAIREEQEKQEQALQNHLNELKKK